MRPPPPDRRLAPRPLPVHLANAMLLWLTSRAALTSLASGSQPSSGLQAGAEPALADAAAALARLGSEGTGALERGLLQRAAGLISGIEAYRRHPYRRREPEAPVRWQAGAARLLDYGVAAAGPALLIVPSLINRYYVLDLLPERSFVRCLAALGIRPLVLDWGEPGDAELGFTLSDYITGPLVEALAAAAALTGGPVGVAGYCMGGLLALALALRQPQEVAGLALLATPWDFHAERPEQARLLASFLEFQTAMSGAAEPVPVELTQLLFMALDPFLGERKFIRFAEFDMAGDGARSFVALEDWINDGVPLTRKVALDCARSWYRDNDPPRGEWRIDGAPVRPQQLAVPSLVVVPSRDRIVPPCSATPLAAAIPGAAVLRPRFGHIGMMASAQAPEAVWQPIAEWLRGALA